MIPKADPLGVKIRKISKRESASLNTCRQSSSSRSLALQMESISMSIALLQIVSTGVKPNAIEHQLNAPNLPILT